MKDEQVYIDQIQDALSKIESFMRGMTREDFHKDPKTQSAVIMQPMLIGEIAKKISDQTKESIDLPWKNIVGFRDMAIHNYFSMDLDIVWNTVQEDIPTLKEKLLEK